ncbi:hypothetical protein MHBO_001676 [Bonamia ostreae]|uniref:Uncharacterized protein n=1 Tax=Bonamia ostreae TaxID=126728 RepID=A0ABV2AJX4_9EUKA
MSVKSKRYWLIKRKTTQLFIPKRFEYTFERNRKMEKNISKLNGKRYLNPIKSRWFGPTPAIKSFVPEKPVVLKLDLSRNGMFYFVAIVAVLVSIIVLTSSTIPIKNLKRKTKRETKILKRNLKNFSLQNFVFKTVEIKDRIVFSVKNLNVEEDQNLQNFDDIESEKMTVYERQEQQFEEIVKDIDTRKNK